MQKPTLYVVGYAHLDTQWRWEYPQVYTGILAEDDAQQLRSLSRSIRTTSSTSPARIDTADERLLPADFERLKQYVAAGRWFPAGSSMDEGDVNSPNAESIIRQIPLRQ
jgi:alpha-mannosidase